MAGAHTLGEIASAIGVHAEEASIVAELKAGSEEAYAWLVAQYHQPVYSLVFRIVNDPADAADATQDVFLKVFRGIRRFHGESSLKTWIYRIAVHEASNRRRWWFRHKSREASMEPNREEFGMASTLGLKDTLVDPGRSPFENVMQEELRARIEAEVQQVPEPYRTTLVLRDLEDFAYEEIAQVLQVSLGTVKSRLMRGRDLLRKRLEPLLHELGPEWGAPAAKPASPDHRPAARRSRPAEVKS